MTHTSVLALALLLAAAPVAAQPKKEGPAGPGPIGPGPMDIGPIKIDRLPDLAEIDRAFKLAKPVIDDMAAEAPLLAGRAKMIVDSLAFDLAKPAIADAVAEAPMLAARAKMLADSVAFEYQDKTDREAERRDREAELRERERERESQWYSEGQNAADEYRWDRALSYFTRVAELKGSKADAALYWKAFAQNRLGQRTEALATIGELSKNYANSPYRRQATVLEAELKRDIGQPVRPQDSADDEVKLMALQALQNTAPEEAVPMLEKVLEGTSSRKVKERALFVLAQSKSPRAREVLRNYAKGSSTPELQSQAIRYLGVHGGAESRTVLAEVYSTTTDVDVKRRILRAFMTAGEKDRLFKAAQGEQNPELRMEAVSQLGAMGAHEELWQLYQKESSADVKRRIIRSMMAGGSIDRLIELAKSEQNPELRREAVRALGSLRSARSGDVLLQIYSSDNNVDVKKSVVNALFIQDNATALVGLARKEQDVTMKKEIVSRLSNMRSKVATDYMIELLGK
jgi:HEAT repeat protein